MGLVLDTQCVEGFLIAPTLKKFQAPSSAAGLMCLSLERLWSPIQE